MKEIRYIITALKWGFLVIVLMSVIVSCRRVQRSQVATKQSYGISSTAATASDPSAPYAPPAIPPVLATPEERAAYLAAHYWDNFHFTDTTLISRAELTEQALVDFIGILPLVLAEKANIALRSLMASASVNSAMFTHFIDLTEKYLYDPNSPLRNEEYYIAVLQYVVASPKLEEIEKVRPLHQLEIALKNRPGAVAADFIYTLADGRKGRLKDIKSDYTILFFNNPDCHDCQRIKELLEHEITADRYPDVKILAVYLDEDLSLWRRTKYPSDWINGYDKEQVLTQQQLYDLKAIPTLYLLDRDKRVIGKDIRIEELEHYLKREINDKR